MNTTLITPVTEPAYKNAEFESVLRERIAHQAIPPGSKLSESDLASEFNVSRAQVREAFAVLASRGLIERIPNRGAVVMRLDSRQVSEIFAVREALEGMCARLAALNTTSAYWQHFIDLYEEQMPAYLAAGDFESFLTGYEKFRTSIIAAANNQALSEMLDSIREKILVLSRRIIILPGRGEQALKEHRAILAALYRGDADAAEAHRKENMRSGQAWFERFSKFVL
jgi:DNA-binding GntR family transcriptional regulator